MSDRLDAVSHESNAPTLADYFSLSVDSEAARPKAAALAASLHRLPSTVAAYDCCFLLVRHFLAMDDPIAAHAPACRARDIAVALGDRLREAQAGNAIGVSLMSAGQIVSALKPLNEALTAAGELNDNVLAVKCLLNLGVCYHRVADPEQSIRLYEEALERCGGDPALDEPRRSGLSNLAFAYLLMGRTGEALDCATRATDSPPAAADSMSAVERGMALSNQTLVLLRTGATEPARKPLAALRQLAGEWDSPDVNLMSDLFESIFLALGGDTRAAKGLLESCLQRIEHLSVTRQIDLLQGVILAHEFSGQFESALGACERLMDLDRRFCHQALQRETATTAAAHSATTVATRLAQEVTYRFTALSNSAVSAKLRAGYDYPSTYRVGRLAELFAAQLDMDAHAAKEIGLAARLCDVGMQLPPARLLARSGPLSREERKLVYEHLEFGADHIALAQLEGLSLASTVARYHHEQWDGSGPRGLSGLAIPMAARIVALCDAFEAMTHARPYRSAKSVPAAVREIQKCAGTQFDPELTPRFAAFVRELYWSQDNFDDFLAEDARNDALLQLRLQTQGAAWANRSGAPSE